MPSQKRPNLRRSKRRSVQAPLISPNDALTTRLHPTSPIQTKGSTEEAQVEVDRDTDLKLVAVREAFNKNKGTVVEKLLDRVVLVEPKLHRNLTRAEQP